MAYGFYEHRPHEGTEFTTDADELDTVESVIKFDENEGAWLVWAENEGKVYIQLDDNEWVQVS